MAGRVYTAEEIKKLSPGYRGKPENFDPLKVKSMKKQRAASKLNIPKALTQDTQKSNDAKPMRQKNESILPDIFAQDIIVVPMAPLETFSASYAALPEIAKEVYQEYAKDVKQIDRLMIKEEMSYYFTAMLWLRLIDVKMKQRLVALTSEERTLHEDTQEEKYTIPQPLYEYLASIGAIFDKMGKRTYLSVPTLPVSCVGALGGYHADTIDVNTHNLFEEIPSLGVAGDMVMAACSEEDEPRPNFHVRMPDGSAVSDNLTGCYPIIGPRRIEIRQKLSGFRITTTIFDEYCHNTRFNLRYIRRLSDIIGTWKTFKLERVCFQKMLSDGLTVQAVMSKPIPEETGDSWIRRRVQNLSVENDPVMMDAAFMFLFQLYKTEDTEGTPTERNKNWCCIKTTGEWTIPEEWIENRNSRRDLPGFLRCERFETISNRDVAFFVQKYRTLSQYL